MLVHQRPADRQQALHILLLAWRLDDDPTRVGAASTTGADGWARTRRTPRRRLRGMHTAKGRPWTRRPTRANAAV